MRAAGLEPALARLSTWCLYCWATRAKLADGARIERAHPCGLGALPTRCIATLPTVLADGRGIEPRQPCGWPRLSKAAPYLSVNHPHVWRRAEGSNPTPRGAHSLSRRVAGHSSGALRNHVPSVCSGAPSWIRTSNLRVLSAAPLPGWTTGADCGLVDEGALCAQATVHPK